MLKIQLSQPTTYSYPVSVQWPSKTGHVKKKFIGEFKLLDKPDADALIERVKKYNKGLQEAILEGDESAASSVTLKSVEREVCEEVLIGWNEELCDENGEKIPVNDETKIAILNNPILLNAIWSAYKDSIGGNKARLGN